MTTIARLTALLVPLALIAQGPPSTPHPLAGTWDLVTADDIRPDGTRVPAYGTNPAGRLMVDDEGRYSLQIFRTDRPRFEAGSKSAGTAEEFRLAVLGISTHTGTIEVDSGGGVLIFRIEHSAFPNWEGTTQRRAFTLAEGVLSYRLPTSAGTGGNTPLTAWRRAAE